jgi:hypothetical protein
MKGANIMVHSVNDTKEFNARVGVGIGVSSKSGNDYIYCELPYWDKISNKRYNKVYPAAKFDKVCNVYYAINNGLIPASEMQSTIEHIK